MFRGNKNMIGNSYTWDQGTMYNTMRKNIFQFKTQNFILKEETMNLSLKVSVGKKESEC